LQRSSIISGQRLIQAKASDKRVASEARRKRAMPKSRAEVSTGNRCAIVRAISNLTENNMFYKIIIKMVITTSYLLYKKW